jgi:hypothetical protein
MSDFSAPQILTKQPGEKRKLSMDFSNWVSSSVTLTNAEVTSELLGGGSSDLTITGVTISGKRVLFFVEGGTQAKSYIIQVEVTTNEGEILQGDGSLRVINK